jgi:hypothetical protein
MPTALRQVYISSFSHCTEQPPTSLDLSGRRVAVVGQPCITSTSSTGQVTCPLTRVADKTWNGPDRTFEGKGDCELLTWWHKCMVLFFQSAVAEAGRTGFQTGVMMVYITERDERYPPRVLLWRESVDPIELGRILRTDSEVPHLSSSKSCWVQATS